MAMNFDEFVIRLRETDDVGVTKRLVKAGTELANGSLRLVAGRDIPPGHKVALSEIADGAPVRKYGQVIGFAKGRVAPGEHVHTHNLVVKDFGRDYQFCTEVLPVNYYPADQMRLFQGYSRPNDRA